MIARINTDEGRATREKIVRARRTLMSNLVIFFVFAVSIAMIMWILKIWIYPK